MSLSKRTRSGSYPRLYDWSPDFKNIKVYPNPTSSKINIEGLDGKYQIDILNVHGSKCKSVNFYGSSTVIDISDLPSALYIFSITNETENYSIKINKK